ncbi:MAG: serine/threonine-protein phosphatase [Oscillospiraceae bacterium]|nr:serine/threonine-protein phosphatase [Oscillospiraceae bacterium]
MTLNDIMHRLTRTTAKSRDRDRASLLAELVTRFAIGFILSGASILSGLSPFAAAFAASSGAGIVGLVTMLGVSIGYFLFWPFLPALRYVSVTLIVVATSAVFRYTEVYRSRWFMPMVSGVLSVFIGFIVCSDGGWTLPEAILIASDAVLCLGCTYFYKTALSPWSGQLNFEGEVVHTVSVLILLATALVSLAGLKLFGVLSVGRCAAALVVFLAAYKGGAGTGSVTGLAVGLAMDASGAAAPMFSAAFGVAGLVAGIFSKRSRFLFTLAFIIVDAAAAAMALHSAAVPSILYEVFAASVIFMLLPPSLLARLGAFLPERAQNGGAIRAREYTRRRVEQASFAFRDLHDASRTLLEQSRETDNSAVVFDRAADAVCRRCNSASRCWQEGYNATVDVMNNLTPVILRRGRLEKGDFPDYFADECENLDAFISAVNYELRSYLYRRRLKSRLRGNRAAALNQYSEVSDILHGISAELGDGLRFEPELETRTRKYLQSLGVVADVSVFRDRGGRLHSEISGAELNAFKRDRAWLDKLSVVLGVRLCVPEGRPRSGRLELLEAEPLAASVGVSRMNKHGNDVNGDTGAYFKTDEGVLYVLLSDGMGAGEEAACLSSDAVRILERFLRSGVAPETAVRMLGDIMLLRNEEDVGCVTVDLACVNLFSGEVTLLKYGAAPSYVKSGATVTRVKGKSLAAGLGSPPDDKPDSVTVALRPGMYAVVVSDGAVHGSDDSALVKLISDFSGDEPGKLTYAIVEAARARGAAEDDTTAIAIKITARE